MEQTYEPMYKNRIRGIRRRASGQMTAKPISIKGAGCKFGGCVRKAVELTSGDLPFVRESGLRVKRFILTGRQKSAEGVAQADAIIGAEDTRITKRYCQTRAASKVPVSKFGHSVPRSSRQLSGGDEAKKAAELCAMSLSENRVRATFRYLAIMMWIAWQ